MDVIQMDNKEMDARGGESRRTIRKQTREEVNGLIPKEENRVSLKDEDDNNLEENKRMDVIQKDENAIDVTEKVQELIRKEENKVSLKDEDTNKIQRNKIMDVFQKDVKKST